MKVNLGCADRYVDGWVNVDWAGSPHRKDVELDLALDLMPWPAYTVTDVYAGHVLEHIEYDKIALTLRDVRDCMVAGGRIMVVGPDCNKARQLEAMGLFDHSWGSLNDVIDGDHRWPGTEHKWECTTPLVVELLHDAGWYEITDVGIEHVSNFWPVVDRVQRWQFAVGAVARW
jgi:hypothetical protein